MTRPAAPPGAAPRAGRALRALAVSGAASATTLVLLAAPALAAHGEGEDTSAEVGLGTALVLYVALPFGLLALIGAVVWLPNLARSNRYRPQRGWSAPPVWFGGPADPAEAIARADRGSLVRGGAHGDW